MAELAMMPMPPLPLQAVPAPPWANYNTRVSMLRSMKSRFGHMDCEVYAPGQNPGYFNPWVTMPHQMVPAPNTPQYGGPWPTAPTAPAPSSLRHGGWVQVQIRSSVDAETDTIADRLHASEELPWMYAEVDGWALNFYPRADSPGPVRGRATSVDLRPLRRVEVASQFLGPPVVQLIFEAGSFKFYTHREEEAEHWRSVLTAVFTQSRQAALQRQATAQAQAAPLESSGPAGLSSPASFGRHAAPRLNPALQGPLRVLWSSCVKAMSQGECPGPDVFESIFLLYDVNGDGSLSFQELKQMVRDLLEVRKVEAERALGRRDQLQAQAGMLDLHSQEQIRGARGTMSSLGESLLADYAAKLDVEGFESRCILLQSQLDLSADQRVALPEFLAAAPRVLLPEAELRAEAQFYRACSKALRLQKKAAFFTAQGGGGDEDESEGICVHQ